MGSTHTSPDRRDAPALRLAMPVPRPHDAPRGRLHCMCERGAPMVELDGVRYVCLRVCIGTQARRTCVARVSTPCPRLSFERQGRRAGRRACSASCHARTCRGHMVVVPHVPQAGGAGVEHTLWVMQDVATAVGRRAHPPRAAVDCVLGGWGKGRAAARVVFFSLSRAMQACLRAASEIKTGGRANEIEDFGDTKGPLERRTRRNRHSPREVQRRRKAKARQRKDMKGGAPPPNEPARGQKECARGSQ